MKLVLFIQSSNGKGHLAAWDKVYSHKQDICYVEFWSKKRSLAANLLISDEALTQC